MACLQFSARTENFQPGLAKLQRSAVGIVGDILGLLAPLLFIGRRLMIPRGRIADML